MDHEVERTHPHPHQEHHEDEASVKTLLSWNAPGRPFKRKGREFYAAVAALVLLISIVLFLFHEYVLMLTVFALTFLSLALSSIPPRDFHYKITNHGVKIEDTFFIWQELYDFYFKKMNGMDVLIVRTESLVPGELHFCLGEITKNHLKEILGRYLPYREVVKSTFMEKSGDWLARNFPLERES